VQESPVEQGGDVVARLAQLQVKAADHWGKRVTKNMVVEATGVSLKTVQALSMPFRRQTIALYDLLALGKLCWYFGCEIDDLLAYRPQGGASVSLPDVQVRRASPPGPGEAPPQAQVAQIRLPDTLSGERVPALMRAMGRGHDTIAAIRAGKPRRVKRTTLAALCTAASRKGARPVRMGEVLVYNGPRPWETLQGP
jgi:DNA-binding Xre family transcriptional regulator